MSDDERRYSREEVALVLRKVAQRSPALSSSEELTRAELREVVQEAGLDITEVDGALAELETQHKTDARLLGLQQYVVVRRLAKGPLNRAQMQRANKLINRSIGMIGESEVDEQGLSWFGRHVSVSISQEGGKLSLHIEERFHNTTRGQLAAGLTFSVMAGMMILIGAANGGMEGLGFVLGASMPAAAYGVLRRLHAARAAATQRRLEGLGDQLVAMLGEDEGGEQPSAPNGSESSAT